MVFFVLESISHLKRVAELLKANIGAPPALIVGDKGEDTVMYK